MPIGSKKSAGSFETMDAAASEVKDADTPARL